MAKNSRKLVPFGAIPSVSLLPERQRAEQLHEKTLPKLLLAVVLSGLIAGLIWAAGMVPVTMANQELRATEDESTRLLTEIGQYAEVQKTLSAVGALSGERQKLTANEVLFMELRDEIARSVPDGSTLTTFSAALPDAAAEASAATSSGALCAASGVSVTLTLSTPDGTTGLTRASQLIEGVAGLEGFICSEVLESRTEATEESAVTAVQIRFAFDETLRSGRFAEEEQ